MPRVAATLRAPVIGPHTVADWLALDPTVDGSRVELIFGYLHITRGPSGEHQRMAFRLACQIEDAVLAAKRQGLYVVPAVNVRISTAWRTAFIPDVVILDRKPVGLCFPADALAPAVEVWSPDDPCAERETRMAGYALAGVAELIDHSAEDQLALASSWTSLASGWRSCLRCLGGWLRVPVIGKAGAPGPAECFDMIKFPSAENVEA